jgi:anti-sigma regulatory factor (Ser/Thr protein kinase)/putative methionine-R-sulfoxide reductase with GAF domain
MASVESGARTTASERLRRIEAVTDVALVHLDVADLLDELLAQVRELLEVDTAAVLLSDGATGELVATAAAGIEEEVRQGVRIPVGVGFAGRIAAEVKPVVIDDLDRGEVYNPILREKGIRSLLGVPLVAQGRVIGVIHVGSLTSRLFTSEETELLEMAASRVAPAVEARRSNVEQTAAAALQRSLIPSLLPQVPGLEFAARYMPAEGGVGGDWYDVFSLPGGRVGVAIGDVVGRGLAAAVVMGRLRSALRAYALEVRDPAVVLERLDRKLQHFEPGQMTTLLYGVFNPGFTEVEISSAGHPLPVIAVPGSVTTLVEAPVDPPLGLSIDRRRRTSRIDLPGGSALALFTDGLVERRGERIDEGFERLRAVLTPGPAEQSCRAAVAALYPETGWEDDAALLIIRRDDTGNQPLVLQVPAVPTSLEHIRAAVRRWLASIGVSDSKSVDVVLGIGEATGNVVEHAYGPGGGIVEVEMAQVPAGMVATIRDTGQWRTHRGDNRGRGMTIMKVCADEVSIKRTTKGTEVTLEFRLDHAGW